MPVHAMTVSGIQTIKTFGSEAGSARKFHDENEEYRRRWLYFRRRNEPVGMRVMKGNGSNEAEDQIVADIRPSTHPDGVLRGEVRLDEGLYTVTIAAEKQNLMRRPQYLLRVHMTDYQKLLRSVGVPLFGVLLAAWLLYKLIRSKWVRNWWAAPRS